jgi:hypothetical protein
LADYGAAVKGDPMWEGVKAERRLNLGISWGK